MTIIIAIAPIAMTRLRKAKDADEPTTIWISVVSAVSRDSTSPVRVDLEEARAEREHMAEDAWTRTSAVTRSPIQVTR